MLLAGRERPALVFVRPPSSIDTHKYVDLYETNGVASHPPSVTPNAPHVRRLVLRVIDELGRLINRLIRVPHRREETANPRDLITNRRQRTHWECQPIPKSVSEKLSPLVPYSPSAPSGAAPVGSNKLIGEFRTYGRSRHQRRRRTTS